MNKKRILLCATLISTIEAFLIPHIRMLQELGYTVDVAGQKNTSVLDNIVKNVYDIPFKRTPFSFKNFQASRMLGNICRYNHYDIVHFHTPVASVFGRLGVRKYRREGTKIYYTAHGFHFYKGAPVKNWILYYPAEKCLSKFTDTLITINNEDYNRAKSFSPNRVEYVHGVGLETGISIKSSIDRREMRKELGTNENTCVLLSVGELNKNKNHEIIIKSLANLKNSNVHYYIAGQGILHDYLSELARTNSVAEKVHLLGYRKDINDLCNAADIFCFPSQREGLPVSIMEAMASCLPVICSDIRGNNDLIRNGDGGFLVKPDDVDGFTGAIDKLVGDSHLRKQQGLYNVEAVKKFELASVVVEMEKIYGGHDPI